MTNTIRFEIPYKGTRHKGAAKFYHIQATSTDHIRITWGMTDNEKRDAIQGTRIAPSSKWDEITADKIARGYTIAYAYVNRTKRPNISPRP